MTRKWKAGKEFSPAPHFTDEVRLLAHVNQLVAGLEREWTSPNSQCGVLPFAPWLPLALKCLVPLTVPGLQSKRKHCPFQSSQPSWGSKMFTHTEKYRKNVKWEMLSSKGRGGWMSEESFPFLQFSYCLWPPTRRVWLFTASGSMGADRLVSQISVLLKSAWKKHSWTLLQGLGLGDRKAFWARNLEQRVQSMNGTQKHVWCCKDSSSSSRVVHRASGERRRLEGTWPKSLQEGSCNGLLLADPCSGRSRSIAALGLHLPGVSLLLKTEVQLNYREI